MKVTKQESQGTKSRSHNHVTGKKFENISLRKTETSKEIGPTEGAMSASPCHQLKGTEIAKIKLVNEVNTILPGHQQDSLNVSTETPVLLSGDGILRQALLSFSYSGQEMRSLKETIGKKNDIVAKAQTVAVSNMKLSCSAPVPLSPDTVQKALTHGTLPAKSLSSGTLLTGSLPLGNFVSLPPLAFMSETFSHKTLPLVSLTSGALPPVSELAHPSLGGTCSASPRNTISVGVATMPGSVPILSEVPAYEVTQSLKVLVSLSPSIQRTAESQVQTQASAPSKESAVTLVYSSIPKMEPSNLNASHSLSLPPMSEMKSHLQALSHDSHSASVNEHSDNICEVAPVSTDVSDCASRASISVLSLGGTASAMRSDGNHDSAEVDAIKNVSVSQSVSFQTNNCPSPDSNHIIIPVSSGISSGKVDDHHVLSAQDIGQIITIPLTSSAIYGHPVGISIPISGNTVPVQGILPMSCSLLPVPGNTATNPLASETSGLLVPTTGSVQSYPSTVETAAQHSHLSTNTCGLVTVTSSMALPISHTNTVASVTSVSTNDVADSVSAASTATSNTSTTMVFAAQSASVESASAMQSPAEILSQLSKAGVLPTMSSSQVSSVLSALTADPEAEHPHNVTQVQLTSSADKVSTLTQTEDLDLGCNISVEPQNNKVMNTTNEIHLERVGRLHVLNHTHGSCGIDTASLSPSVSLPEKHSFASNVTSIDSIHVEVNPRVIGPVTIDSDTLKQTPSMYPRIVPKINLAPNEIISTGLIKSNLSPKLLIPKHGSESVTSCRGSDVNREQRIVSVFIKQENFENSVSHRVNKSGVDRPRDKESKKRRLENINNGKDKNAKCIKETKNHSMKDEELDSYVEQIACYKCKCCHFLALEKEGVLMHLRLAHGSELPGIHRAARLHMKCPGCENVFFSSKSLRVHLSQDHQAGDEELKTLVDVVVRSSCKDAKTKIKFRKRGRRRPAADECSKIRVRDLNSEVLPKLDTSSNADSVIGGGDARRGTLVIDDNRLTQQKHAKITVDICEFKMMRTDTGQVARPEIAEVQQGQRVELKSNQGMPSLAKKKPGRPKGSKNIPADGYQKSSSGQKVLVDKEMGYRCDIDGCAVRLRSHDKIEYHRRCHHDEKFLCPECSQETVHWKSLSTHLWRFHVIDMELFACDQCNYKTNSYSKLMNLHRRIHGDERPFLCDACGKGFKNRKQLRNHKAIHVAKQKQKAGPIGKCDVCGRSFTSARMLRVHKDNVHGKLRPHLCNFCAYSASSRSTLKMHMRLHTGEKPFHCDICEYATADHNSLRRHKMRHSGQKPYKCPHCTYACIQSSTFKVHLNAKHPGMETGFMFNCDLCSFRSVREDNYMAHIAEHKNESYPSNRHRNHNSPKPQSDSNKKPQHDKTSPRLENPQIDISHIIAPVGSGEGTVNENPESSNNVHLIYNGSAVERLLQRSSEEAEGRFGVEISSDSVIHLVEKLDANNDTSGQHMTHSMEPLCVTNIETVTQMPLTPEFEAEQITGDIQDIKEPQELKFKVVEDTAS